MFSLLHLLSPLLTLETRRETCGPATPRLFLVQELHLCHHVLQYIWPLVLLPVRDNVPFNVFVLQLALRDFPRMHACVCLSSYMYQCWNVACVRSKYLKIELCLPTLFPPSKVSPASVPCILILQRHSLHSIVFYDAFLKETLIPHLYPVLLAIQVHDNIKTFSFV